MYYKELIPLYEGSQIIGTVRYTNNLDIPLKHSMGSIDIIKGTIQPGKHLGIGKTNNGKYYVVFGSDYPNEPDYAKVVPKDVAISYIIKTTKDEQLFKELFNTELPILSSSL